MPHENDGVNRLRTAAEFQPLLMAWGTEGPAGDEALSRVELDTVTVALEAIESAQDLVVRMPGGRGRLPLLAAVAAAIDPLVRPFNPTSPGTLAFVTRDVMRRADIEALDVSPVPVAPTLNARRLRGDGLVCRSGGGGIGPLCDEYRLLFVSPHVFARPTSGRIRAVVVDDTSDPDSSLTQQAVDWARPFDVPVVAFTHLSSLSHGSVGWPVDWPYLRAYGGAAGLDPNAPPMSGTATCSVIADGRLVPLFRVRATLTHLFATNRPWPPALGAIARFARLLTELPVPPATFDNHVAGPPTRTLAGRRAALEASSRDALAVLRDDITDAQWTSLKQDVIASYDALAAVNHKATAIGMAIQSLIDAHRSVDVLAPSTVAAAALRTWLLRQSTDDVFNALADGRLAVRPINEPGIWARTHATLVCALPRYRWRHRLTDGDIGQFLMCGYPPEASRLPGLFDAGIGRDAHLAEHERTRALDRLFGCPGRLEVAPITVTVTALTTACENADVEAFDDLPLIDLPERELDTTAVTDTPAVLDDSEPPAGRARALIVVPVAGGDPVGVIVDETATLHRVSEHWLVPVSAADLREGMLVIGVLTESRDPLFERIRPHLDRLYGPGTRTWLDSWRECLRRAVHLSGSPQSLAARLRELGATIADGTVAGWSSPYRIGPRDVANIRRVAQVSGMTRFADRASHVGRAMEAVRQLHRKIGVTLSAAIRAAAAGRSDAFDDLEVRLGIAVAELLGDVTPWRVLTVSDAGWAPQTHMWRPLPPLEAHAIFKVGATGAG